MARSHPRVLSIAPGADFAATFAANLLDGRIIDLPFRHNPLLIADLVIHVPTQRLRTALEGALAAALAPNPAILPVIRPLAEPGDPLDRILDLDAGVTFAGGARRLIAPLERRFMLLPLIEAWQDALQREDAAMLMQPPPPPANLAGSLALADALGRLIDEALIEDVPLGTIERAEPENYDPARFDRYWAQTREFLAIAARFWPDQLDALQASDRMSARLQAIDAEAQRLERDDPKTPVLVVGSTGSVQATARLMRAIARRECGAVILPGLDFHLDEPTWQMIGDNRAGIATRFAHPQASLKRSLETIGITRADVLPLGILPPAHSARNIIVSEALRPAETSARWREARASIDLEAGLAGLCLVEAEDEEEEALAIALLMRETLETPDATMALVSADRGLARRVASQLRRWGIVAADSAGQSLGESPAGAFARLALAAALHPTGPALLALARHPLLRLQYDAETRDALIDALEIAVLRGRHFLPSLSLPDRVAHALNEPANPYAPLPRQRLAPTILAALPAFAQALHAALAPFSGAASNAFLAAHARSFWEMLEELSRDETGVPLCSEGNAGALLEGLCDEIARYGHESPVSPADFADAFGNFLREAILPPPAGGHPRLAILGPLESRLLSADRVILGGVNEGSFPPDAQSDPFLNRAMRLSLKLQPPERRIGQSAHDFMMLAGHQHLVLTRAKRVDHQPSIPSRFLRRLAALAGAPAWGDVQARGNAILANARRLDAPEPAEPLQRPAPIPAFPRVPARLNLTEAEILRRDPYALYARHILKLHRLEPVDARPDARDRGTFLHKALERFVRLPPPLDPEIARQVLRDIGRDAFAPLMHERELHRFWWARFLDIVPGFIVFDRSGRDEGRTIFTEIRARYPLLLASGESIILSGRADRLEIDQAGQLHIFDYKSGPPPGNAEVLSGYAPQLTLTAALALAGAFEGLPAVDGIATLAYLPVGGGQKDCAPVIIRPHQEALGTLAQRHLDGLRQQLLALARGEVGYGSHTAMRKRRDGGDYDHLARLREWVLVAPGEDGEDLT